MLVSTFYGKVRKNPEIGFYFNDTIQDWPAHIEKLTDFWESNLFFVSKFRGNPRKTHQEVDDNFNNSIEQRHFGEWLNLWFSTIDEYFEGERANLAKNRARNMAHHLFLNIFKSRSN
ncbi:MAG TPA: group III truncated hemoglobin [Salinimicrobium sp.]|nr:group III truncated hemoglobin [Salinimicrobium sp.]